MNNAAKATEIRLKRPIRMMPRPAVSARPAIKVASTARISLGERRAANRINPMIPNVPERLTPIFSEIVPNSSSSSGTCPVSRSVTPWSLVSFRSAAVLRTMLIASAPGCSAE